MGYSSRGGNATQDAAVTTLYSAALSKPLGRLSFKYEISVYINLISWTGWKHKIQSQIDFNLAEYYTGGDASQLLELLDAMFKPK